MAELAACTRKEEKKNETSSACFSGFFSFFFFHIPLATELQLLSFLFSFLFFLFSLSDFLTAGLKDDLANQGKEGRRRGEIGSKKNASRQKKVSSRPGLSDQVITLIKKLPENFEFDRLH